MLLLRCLILVVVAVVVVAVILIQISTVGLLSHSEILEYRIYFLSLFFFFSLSVVMIIITEFAICTSLLRPGLV